MTHAQGKEDVRKELEQLDKFHILQFVHLVAKMDAIEEGEGKYHDRQHDIYLGLWIE